VAELVVAECGEEERIARKACELDGGDCAGTAWLGPDLTCLNDRARFRDTRDAHELHPLHVADNGDSHGGSLTLDRWAALEQMMETVRLPPFERFYEENRDAIYAHLRRVVGPNGADDAFQETFLRALRGYPKLRHGEHLRAWAFTIAARVAIDVGRRSKPTVELVDELPTSDSRPAYAELEHLAGELPGKERAAVILRYGYDFPYSDIADALDSSEEAARAAASSGVRRLRRKLR